ncbi:DUF2156 domain-containing protein [Clostridium tarantellae]|uniref:DUF2156 domain-containing protein n=1 Tax=Clostridium tarantellae TaxID=39493 RepID=A0A6I1MJI2_9CLOT|nr:phosphatidylglycerol lysyltransferase domain-containing protein [Clostridium tarantellae]MPQ43545.1 DUF2156 domain-containing protein [Clostridium tarantellae]
MFKDLQLKDKEIFTDYLKKYKFKSCEYSFTTLYMWRNRFNTKYDILNNILIIKKEESEEVIYFMQPLSKNKFNIKEIIPLLKSISKGKYLFGDVEKEFLLYLINEFEEKIYGEIQKGNSDYIYVTGELLNLCGRKYNKKRNHCNCFMKNYKFEVLDVNRLYIVNDSIKFCEEWYEMKNNKSDALKYELEGIKDILINKEFLNLDAMAIYIDGKIQGLTIGENINNEMAIIHVEKCNKKYNGIYSFINREFVRRYYKNVKYVNRQDDMGILGLRNAKLSYFPRRLEKKYKIKFL